MDRILPVFPLEITAHFYWQHRIKNNKLQSVATIGRLEYMCQSRTSSSKSIRFQQFLQSPPPPTTTASTAPKPSSNMSERTKMSDYSTCSNSTNPAASSVEGSEASDRSLRFSRLAKVYCIPALCEYSAEEISEMWTTDEDMERSQASVVDVIRYMRNDCTSVDLDLDHRATDNAGCIPCIRGLEHLMTQERIDRRQRHKEKVYDSVLEEQFDQEAKGLDVLDVEAIAAASERHSQSAKDAALARGTADAEYVKLHVYYDEIDTAVDDEDQGRTDEKEDAQVPHDLVTCTTSKDKATDGQPQGNQFFSTLFTALDLSSEEMSATATNPSRTSCASASTASEATDSFYEKLHSLKLRSGAKVLNRLYQDDSKKANLRFMLARQNSFGANSA